jgi:hypothetical protein
MNNLSRCLVLSILSLSLIGSRPLLASESASRSVDYVIGMLEAGVAQPAIVARIHDKSLTFVLAEGDVDRLRAAGAGDDLIRAVTGAGAEPSFDVQGPSGKGGEATSRPRRLDRESRGSVDEQGSVEQQAPPDGADESYQAAPGDDESGADQESAHGGYPYYRPGEDDGYHGAYAYYGAPYYPSYYDYYPFSFYYSFYYPSYFYYPYGYYYPYRPYVFYGGRRFPGHGTHVGPVVPRGSFRGSWSGSGGRPSSPRGSAPHARPRGH